MLDISTTQNRGTTGGAGGAAITVTTVTELAASLKGDTAAIVVVSGIITGAENGRIGSNKTLVGPKGSKLVGIGLVVRQAKSLTIRNIVSEKVIAANGDGIGIQSSSNVGVDHCELSSDMEHSKDYYDGLWMSTTLLNG